jgi:hypothetical protein
MSYTSINYNSKDQKSSGRVFVQIVLIFILFVLQVSTIFHSGNTNPLSQHYGFDHTYPWQKTSSNWNADDDWEIINRMQASGIYVTQQCQRDPKTGTFENRFCHQDSDCCYTLEFVKSIYRLRTPCRMECRISNLPPAGSNDFSLSSVQTCQFTSVYNNCE